jgi:hypothetical protein
MLVLPSWGTCREEAHRVELLPLWPLPTVLGVLALGSVEATLIPGRVVHDGCGGASR